MNFNYLHSGPLAAAMRCVVAFASACILASHLAASAMAQTPDLFDTSRDVDAILKRGHLIVAMTSFDNPPFYSGEGDELEGIDISLARSIAEALGVELVFDRVASSFDNVVGRVAEGNADIAISKLSRTYRRTARVAFSEPYVRLRHALVFNRLRLAQIAEGRDIAETVRAFDGRLGVIGHSSFAGYAAQRFPDAEVVAFASWKDAVDATIDGRVDAAYRDEYEIRRIAVDYRDATLKLRTVAISDARDAIAMAISWDAPRLLAIANQVVDNMPQQLSVNDLIDRYRTSVGADTGE